MSSGSADDTQQDVRKKRNLLRGEVALYLSATFREYWQLLLLASWTHHSTSLVVPSVLPSGSSGRAIAPNAYCFISTCA